MDLRERLSEALSTAWLAYDDEDMSMPDFGHSSVDAILSTFAAWLRERAAETAAGTETPTKTPTARTIALVRIDTIQRLVDEISPDTQEQTT